MANDFIWTKIINQSKEFSLFVSYLFYPEVANKFSLPGSWFCFRWLYLFQAFVVGGEARRVRQNCRICHLRRAFTSHFPRDEPHRHLSQRDGNSVQIDRDCYSLVNNLLCTKIYYLTTLQIVNMLKWKIKGNYNSICVISIAIK